eukprot:3507-Heterococcus_DN1.PRE.3
MGTNFTSCWGEDRSCAVAALSVTRFCCGCSPDLLATPLPFISTYKPATTISLVIRTCSIQRNANPAEIKRAYKKKSLEMHPDKLRQRGGGEVRAASTIARY